MGGTALGASGRSNNGLKLDVKTGKLSLWRLFPTFTFTLPGRVLPLPAPLDLCNTQLSLCTMQPRTIALLAAFLALEITGE